MAAILVLLALGASAASAGVLEDRLGATRSEGRQVKQEIAVVDRRQQVVVRQISRLNDRIEELDVPLQRLEQAIAGLDSRIQHRQDRIEDLQQDYRRQAVEIRKLGSELRAARELLNARVVAAYTNGDTGMLEQLASVGSLRELFDREEALSQVVGLDKRIIDRISSTEHKVRVTRSKNHERRSKIRADIAQLAEDRDEVDSKRASLQQRRDEVAGVRAERDEMLDALNGREDKLHAHLDDLQADAKVLKQVIETGQATYGGQVGSVSSAGFVWPVQGPVVSPFGPRWGRMHEGIDIAISAGNPIIAAQAGVVTHAGWMGGYGNMVIVQHAGSLATGYAHQSQIAVHTGQLVSQGQLLGFVGCTGHCFGDHLHFEVYVNGAPNDPMRFL